MANHGLFFPIILLIEWKIQGRHLGNYVYKTLLNLGQNIPLVIVTLHGDNSALKVNLVNLIASSMLTIYTLRRFFSLISFDIKKNMALRP